MSECWNICGLIIWQHGRKLKILELFDTFHAIKVALNSILRSLFFNDNSI